MACDESMQGIFNGEHDGCGGVPIMIIHMGDASHLRDVVRKAKEWNPQSRVIFLGDHTNAYLGELGIEHHVVLFEGDARRFSDVYRHCSTLPEQFEKFCFQRWILLRDFMRQEGMEACLHLDSDVLLFCDVTQERAKYFNRCDLNFALWDDQRFLAHFCYINRFRVLDAFCDYLFEVYESPAKWEAMCREMGTSRERKKIWISDMSFWCYFCKSHPEVQVRMFGAVEKDGEELFLFEDRAYSSPNGMLSLPGVALVSKRKLKNVCFRDRVPYVWSREFRQAVRLKVIHAQGFAKVAIPYYASECSGQPYLQLRYYFDAMFNLKRHWVRARKSFNSILYRIRGRSARRKQRQAFRRHDSRRGLPKDPIIAINQHEKHIQT